MADLANAYGIDLSNPDITSEIDKFYYQVAGMTPAQAQAAAAKDAQARAAAQEEARVDGLVSKYGKYWSRESLAGASKADLDYLAGQLASRQTPGPVWWGKTIAEQRGKMDDVSVTQQMQAGKTTEEIEATRGHPEYATSLGAGVVGGNPYGAFQTARVEAIQSLPSLMEVISKAKEGKELSRDFGEGGYGYTGVGGFPDPSLSGLEGTFLGDIADFLSDLTDPASFPDALGMQSALTGQDLGSLESVFGDLGAEEGVDYGYRGYSSLLSDLLSGEKGFVGMLEGHFPEMLLSASLGGLKSVGDFFAALMGESVVGTYTDPYTGQLMAVHESGKVTSVSPEGDPGFDFNKMDQGNEYNPYNAPYGQYYRNSSYDPTGGGAGAAGFDRQSLIDQLISTTQGNTVNPGIDPLYFESIIRQGILDRNEALGDNITQGQFNAAFDTNFLGQGLLDDETYRLRDEANRKVDAFFPGNSFATLDDSIINSIVQERAQVPREQISSQLSRGNFNTTGGRTANEFISRQFPSAKQRVGEVSQGVLGGYQADLHELRDQARHSVSNFNLGDDLFSIAPFVEQRGNVIDRANASARQDVVTALGGEPLFDITGALQSGGRAQGVVSGGGSPVLNTLASRQGGDDRDRRGLGTRGSGVF